ncbi:SGNH/GDSL hydrolase family protein [Aeromicrobium panaciterrae]
MAVIVGVLVAVAGCSSGGGSDAPDESDGAPKISRYVALGDSAVSGPGLDPMDRKAPAECFRSLRNYPHVVAKKLGAKVDDVSCGGATTDTVRDAVKKGRTQLDALKPDTQLVTVGIGANDAGMASGWFKACFLPGQNDAACAGFMAGFAPDLLSQTRTRVTGILDEVKTRSPDATVLLVGYMRFAPSEGTCAVLPISEANRAASEAFERDLAAMLRGAAQEASVGFVDMWSAAEGHDICAVDPWVNGVGSGDGDLLHPTSAGMKAVASEIVRAVS